MLWWAPEGSGGGGGDYRWRDKTVSSMKGLCPGRWELCSKTESGQIYPVCPWSSTGRGSSKPANWLVRALALLQLGTTTAVHFFPGAIGVIPTQPPTLRVEEPRAQRGHMSWPAAQRSGGQRGALMPGWPPCSSLPSSTF